VCLPKSCCGTWNFFLKVHVYCGVLYKCDDYSELNALLNFFILAMLVNNDLAANSTIVVWFMISEICLHGTRHQEQCPSKLCMRRVHRRKLGATQQMFLPKMSLHIFHTRHSKFRCVEVKCCTKEMLCTQRL